MAQQSPELHITTKVTRHESRQGSTKAKRHENRPSVIVLFAVVPLQLLIGWLSFWTLLDIPPLRTPAPDAVKVLDATTPVRDGHEDPEAPAIYTDPHPLGILTRGLCVPGRGHKSISHDFTEDDLDMCRDVVDPNFRRALNFDNTRATPVG